MEDFDRNQATSRLQVGTEMPRLVSYANLKRLETANAIGSNHPQGLINKWKLYDAIKAARAEIGLCHREVAVLHDLITFLPGQLIDPKAENIVFASNKSLLERVQGMGMSTMRRHIAKLVEMGLITRNYSPNGKRYRRRARNGAPECKFGFDLQNLLKRAPEIFQLEEVALEKETENKLAREDLGACLRGTKTALQGMSGTVDEVQFAEHSDRYENLRRRCKRVMKNDAIKAVQEELVDLQTAIDALNAKSSKNAESSSNDARFEHHIQNPIPESYLEEEAADEKKEAGRTASKFGTHHEEATTTQGDRTGLCQVQVLPLLPVGIDILPAVVEATRQSALPDMCNLTADNGLNRLRDDTAARHGHSVDDQAMPRLSNFRDHLPTRWQNTFDRLTVQDVIRICPQIADHAPNGIRTWQDLIATAARVSTMLGISRDLSGLTIGCLGEEQAAVAVAYMLERSETIKSPGGYMRDLTRRADAGKLNLIGSLVALERKRLANAVNHSRSP